MFFTPPASDSAARPATALAHPGEPQDENRNSASEPAAAIDPAAFATLEKSVDVKTLVETLQSYVVTAEHLTDALVQACAEEKWNDAARLAQEIVGAAGGLGLVAITQAARNFAHAARKGGNRHDLRNAAQMVVGEHMRARQTLIQHYPEMA